MTEQISRRNFVRLLSATCTAFPTLEQATPAFGVEQEVAIQDEEGVGSGQYYSWSKDGQECIILRPDTPAPWMNLLANDSFLTWITQRGYIECALLDRYHNGLTNPQEASGLVYLRDRASGEYFCINEPGPGAKWECRHGLGYTVVRTTALGLTAEVTWFVPRSANLVVWLITVQSHQNSSREIDLFTTVEWNLGDLYKNILFEGNGGGDEYTGGSQFNFYKKVGFRDGILYAQQPIWLSLKATARPWPYTGFMAASMQPTSFECVKQNFLGVGRTRHNPLQVEFGECGNHQLWSDNEFPWGVLHHRIRLDGISPHTIAVVTGMTRDEAEIPDLVRRHATAAAAQQDLTAVRTFWTKFLSRTIHVSTPEPEIDRTVNVWTKYQWRSSMLRSETTGRMSLGFWSYGLLKFGVNSGGFFSEVMAQPHDLAVLRDAAIEFMSLQYRDITLGKMYDEVPLMAASDLNVAWPPATPGRRFQYPHSHETDNIYPLADYVVETGDLSFLDEKVPWLDGGSGTVFEHIANALKYAVRGLSPRGLPRLNVGIGDWNDELNGLSQEGKAESIMMAMELCHHLRACASIAERYGRTQEVSEWMQTYDQIKDACNRYAWDGEWYVRAFADGGPTLRPIGTSRDREGRIYLNTQSLAVISGVADGGRARQCMESVGKYLLSPYGPMLLAPAYTHFDRQVGIQSAYAPGWRNANVYFRPAGWAIIAACIAGLPDLAFEIYKKSCISEQSKDVLRFFGEPYAYSENVNGPDHPMAGRALYQWNLGEGANWMWRSYVYYILGVRPVLDGLLVDPCIPANWPGFSVRREFRNTKYQVTVTNPHRLSQGVRRMTIDDRAVSGNVVPVFADGALHRVEVTIGD